MSCIILLFYNELYFLQEVMTKLIWLVMQQPKKILNLLIQQYVSGICGLPTKSVNARKSFLHRVLVEIHSNMNPQHIYQEYTNWLDSNLNLPAMQKQNLKRWVLSY